MTSLDDGHHLHQPPRVGRVDENTDDRRGYERGDQFQDEHGRGDQGGSTHL